MKQSGARSRRVRLSGQLAALAICGAVATPVAAVADDQHITIALPAWPSAQVTAHVIAQTIAAHFQVEVSYEARSSLAALAALDSGDMQVHPEIWLPNMQQAVERFATRGTVTLSPHHVDAWQGACVTRQTADAVGIHELADLVDPDVAAAFDSDGDGKGEMWIGDSTWVSASIEKIRAHTVGYDRTMTLLEAPEEVAMAAVDAAAATGRPMVFYCYAPHALFKLHDVVRLSEPPHDPATWHIVTRAQSGQWLDQSRAATAWDSARFQVGYASALSTERPDIAAFLSNMELTPADAEFMSYAVEVEHRDADEVATEWIAANSDRVAKWLE